jgi:hypothetical protein
LVFALQSHLTPRGHNEAIDSTIVGSSITTDVRGVRWQLPGGACNAAVRIADGNHSSATDEIKAAYCVGVVHAVVFFQKETVIFPEDAYGNPEQLQLIRVVDKYLHDHPEELAKPDTYLVIVALMG